MNICLLKDFFPHFFSINQKSRRCKGSINVCGTKGPCLIQGLKVSFFESKQKMNKFWLCIYFPTLIIHSNFWYKFIF